MLASFWTSGGDWGLILSALITGIFGMVIVKQNANLAKKTKTNHGKTIGQHVETAAADAQEAKLTAQLVALQLQEYKNLQAAQAKAEHDLIEKYVNDDASAHAEIRQLIILSQNKGTT